MRSRLSQLIRHAVLLHLSAASPALVACGGNTMSSFAADSGADSGSKDASAPIACDNAVDAGAPCSVIACQPPQVDSPLNGGACVSVTYGIYGTPDQCGPADSGVLPAATCTKLCPPEPADAGTAAPGQAVGFCAVNDQRQLECVYGVCGTGRTTKGVRRRGRTRAPGTRDEVARFLARMAYLEAAAVLAFERLARELEGHGAPSALRRAIVRAARDEARHARLTTELARRAGASVAHPRLRRTRRRSLEAIARENAVEGCVRETFGAAVVMIQSMTASDPAVRAVMRRIAPDELRHAELSWRLARWLDSRLDEGARVRVARARTRAAQRLLSATSRPVDARLVRDLGLPTATAATALASRTVAWC